MTTERGPIPLQVRHMFATRAGLDWRNRPDLDALPDDDYLAVIRDAWTQERRAAMGAQTKASWRERYPERAAVRDRILAEATPAPCDRCSSPDARLFVTDYASGAYVWRCSPCAIVARAQHREASA